MKTKTYLLVDGGYLRTLLRRANYKEHNADNIEHASRACVEQTKENLLKILYYDARPYKGVVKFSNGKSVTCSPDDAWIDQLKLKDLFAVRLGKCKLVGSASNRKRAEFIQKGVDMRVGLDIASLPGNVEKIILLTGDTDLVPAMKHARKCGIQVVLVQLPAKQKISDELRGHADYIRTARWPRNLTRKT
ncbi:MAG: NYN domain-containing protein [Gammaproteobacteria bacterium]|nr:NYN domain-containing protein [Gammaproteobacteria bacterium]